MTDTICRGDACLTVDMWYDDEFVPGQYGADAFFNDNSATYWGWIYDDNGKMIGSYESDDSVLIEENFQIAWKGADVTACDSVEGTTKPKYMATMVNASYEDCNYSPNFRMEDDVSYKYYVAGYFDNLMRGLSDDLFTDSFDAVLDFANDLAHDDCFIQIKNLQTGAEVFYDASAWYNDVPEDVFEVTM